MASSKASYVGVCCGCTNKARYEREPVRRSLTFRVSGLSLVGVGEWDTVRKR